jgi:hypothetical protein
MDPSTCLLYLGFLPVIYSESSNIVLIAVSCALHPLSWRVSSSLGFESENEGVKS